MPLTLCEFGCVATTAELNAYLKQDSVVDIYQASPGIMRIRRGLYACAHLSRPQLIALGCGGVLDCISALDMEGAELSGCSLDLRTLHVRFDRGDRWARSRAAAAEAPIVAHWHAWRTPRRTALTNRSEYWARRPVVPLGHVPPAEALAQALVCLGPDEASRVIASLEADAEEFPYPMLTHAQIARVVAAAPRRTREALRSRRAAAEGAIPLRDYRPDTYLVTHRRQRGATK